MVTNCESGSAVRSRPRRARRSSALARTMGSVALAAVTMSCGDSTGPDECLASVTLQINAFTTEPQPRFEWVPRCLISELVVFEEATSQTMWTLYASGGARANTIATRTVYGTVPEDAQEEAPAAPLVPGTTYRVTLSATNNGSVDVIGSRTFVR